MLAMVLGRDQVADVAEHVAGERAERPDVGDAETFGDIFEQHGVRDAVEIVVKHCLVAGEAHGRRHCAVTQVVGPDAS